MIGAELMAMIRDAAARLGVHVLMVGDIFQLPPVGEDVSPVFHAVKRENQFHLDRPLQMRHIDLVDFLNQVVLHGPQIIVPNLCSPA